ncbi:UDP-N-acetylmuramoyl-tripeptide--D-alanyl-D-alanine ligase [Luteimonas sp. MC1895]|uniref:UDP-N-acetylmuramoyl-tripeptide--D-alanyl-D- alanine ligase n=1 Tax=Luteimonas sp. MC1895 TaxID=2819513 RepID=UPI0018F0E13F|nr:UDP-N-acetylmuramoyl-tripeptide--D-alanyl-D-alanine ligase [Luteimonas sp. MC1895]MBJ6980248.1 UDP-N-acetylmuramoyl-tripeptide--D-alanyl-D-alanine ligase [Luteimonas sp. MC1895]
MKPMALSQVAQACNGRLQGEDLLVDAVVSDSRTLAAGGAPLFVAIAGDQFDGHAHVAAAAANGAVAALVSHPVDAPLPQVVVGDTVEALGSLARTLQAARVGQSVVAITGSNGKTSVKELALSILGRFATVVASPGNRNNEIGLPLAMIDADDAARFAVYEMGAGKPGDIAYLAAIAAPRVALVNNIAPAHLERMGTIANVADVKGAIYDALPADGTAVVNADDAFESFFAERAHGRRILRFGFVARADVRVRDLVLREDGSDFVLVTPLGEAAVALALPGRHNVANAMAAAALALACDAPLAAIAEGLTLARPVQGRLVRHRLPGAWLVDDSYNANPGSLAAAIDTLATAGGGGWLVLGDMRELGEDAEALHAAAGRRAREAGVARLFALGTLAAKAAEAFGEGGAVFTSHAELAAAVKDALVGAATAAIAAPPMPAVEDARIAAVAAPTGAGRSPAVAGDRPVPTVLVKGSRGSAMDRVVRALLEGVDTDAA